MRKEDLKAELSKINPPEDLIRATLLRMEEAKEKKENPFLSFVNGFRYKTAILATACCALVLVLGIGMIKGTSVKGNPSVVDSRMGEEGPVAQNEELRITAYAPEQESEVMWVKGQLASCILCEVTPSEAAEGIVAHGVLTIEQEDGTVCSADMFFTEQESFMQLTDLLAEEICFAMISEEKDGESRLRVTEVSDCEKK